ncbi:MAG: hypothetical protein IPH54_12690 [Rhodoferax sp.]|nr:hypothetical protein [Rhodoferax sp.]
MQSAAVAEAVHHPLGEYSSQRFSANAKTFRRLKWRAARRTAIPAGRNRLWPCSFTSHSGALLFCACRPARVCWSLWPRPRQWVWSSETPQEGEGQFERSTEREALQEVVVMLRTIEQERIVVSDKTALPASSTLQLLGAKLVGGDFYPVVEKKDKWDQTIGPIKAFAWPMLLQAGGLVVRSGTRLTLSPAGLRH